MEKKVNIFLALLFAMLKTALVFTISYALLLMFYYDSLMKISWRGEFGLFIFIEGFVLWGIVAVYFFGILLPAYFIDKKKCLELSMAEGMKRFLPLAAGLSIPAIALLFAGIFGKGAEEYSFFSITAINIIIIFQIGPVLLLSQINSMKNAK
jgi:hypothetical protein